MNVRVLEDALVDLADGYRFYEKQSSGLGVYFLGASGFVWGIFIDHGAEINRADNPTKAGRLSVTDEVWD
jgi:hypothetical protein